ncbi:hypothetical protein [Rhodopirellula bahusiensis]|uniref:Uncharacterized protein n=1 Tax=Rhodopirellula bahusiensis TaxID=2014065 RepID=A0A2G1VXJ7_9BACT|nr:hypothetical protein [Rhodopirellula bahusiensis]PHQ31498.1 hypothetical protein CEE69_30830 [Rhodopirellula bahusiensis]
MTQNEKLRHLVTLANRGRAGGASGGEARAWAIAEVLLENVPGLDGKATAAIAELISLIEEKPWLDWDEIREEVLDTPAAPKPGNE